MGTEKVNEKGLLKVLHTQDMATPSVTHLPLDNSAITSRVILATEQKSTWLMGLGNKPGSHLVTKHKGDNL